MVLRVTHVVYDWKMPVFILIPKKGNAKDCSKYHTTGLILQLARLHLKFFKLGFSSI